MSKLYFKVASDWEEVVRLRNEIAKLKQELKGMDSTQSPAAFKALNTQLSASTQRMDELVANAAKAGAVMEGDFKKKIFDASQTVNGFTERIIAQKAVVKDIEADVKHLGEAYRTALKRNPLSANSKLNEYNSARKALDEEKAALFGLTQEQANARLSVNKLRDEYSLYKDDAKGVTETNNGIAISWKKALAVIGGVSVLKALGSELIRVRGEFQSMQTAIETIVGKNTAGQLIPQIKELAKISPLTMSDMVGAEKMMLGFNIQADDTIKYLKALSDISMGESSKFNSLTLAFSQMSAAGKLMGQDLNQMINAGFNPLQMISEKTGKSIATLKEEMSKGAISAEMVQQAFIDATSAGGKFYQMSENASKTINGQISMMQDAMDAAFNEMGQKSEGVIMSGIQLTTSLIENYETIGKVLVGMIATYGVYKTALITNIALTHSWTVAARADAVAKGIQTIATKAQTVAQLALNAAMKANPYVLAATLIVGAATAMWALHDSTTAAERAQKKYNKTKADSLQKEEEHKSRLENLIATIQNEYTSSMNRVKAIEAIKKEYPSLFQKYIDEKGHIKDLIGLWKEYNEEVSKNKVETNKKNLSDSTAKIEEYEKMLSLWKKLGENPYYRKKRLSKEELELAEKYKLETESSLRRKLELAKPSRDLYQKDVRSDELAQWQLDLKKSTDAQIKTELEEMKRLQQARKNNKRYSLNVGVGSLKGATTEGELANRIDILQSEYDSRSKTTYKQDYEKAKKDWEDAKKKLSEIEKDKSKFTSKQYEEAKKREETAEKAYKKLGGITGSSLTKQESQAEALRKKQEKYTLLIDKQKLSQIRAEEDAANEIEQIEIDRLQEGSEKVLRQRALNHRKELEAIEREAEDNRRKVIEEGRVEFESNPENKKKSFNAEDFIKTEPAKKKFAIIENVAKENKITSETKYNRGDDLTGLLSEYQDYTDKRISIERKFNEDIATLQEQRKQAVKNGDTEQVEQIDRSIAQATKNKGMELMGLDYDKLKESPEYVRAFENLKETSSETLNSLLTQLENAKQTAAQVLSPDQLREYTSTIQSIMDELDSRNPFQSLSDKKKELAEAEEELANAQRELENAKQTAEAVKDGAKIENGVKSSKFNEKTGKIESTKAYLSEAQALDQVKKKTENYNAAKDKVVKKDNQVKKSEKEVRAQISELADTIDELGKSIGGPAGEIISLIGNIGAFTMTAMSGVEAAADTSANAISTVEKASVILAIISAAMQVAMKIFDMFGKDDTTEKYEKAKEVYESYISILDRVIEKQLELAETLTGDNANAAYNKALETIKLQSENAKVLGKQYLNSGASRKSHSKGYDEVDDMSWEGWKQAANTLGMTVDEFKKKMGGRMTGLFDLTDEQLASLQENAGIFWSQLDSDTQKYADQIANGVEKVAEVMEQRITDTTLIDIDGLRSDFQDLLTDMDADSADFADNFEEYMRNAILNSMLKDEYMDRLTAWREKLYNAMDDGVTEDEYNALKAEGQQIADEMKAKRDAMSEMYNWGKDDDEREASKKGIATASQDSVDENNGRLAVMQEHTYSINENVNRMATGIDTIVSHTINLSCLASIDKTMQSLLTMRNEAVGHLSNIDNYTSNLVEMKQYMNSMKQDINTMLIKGLKLSK